MSGFDNDKPEAVVRKWYDSYRASGGGMTWEKFLESVRSGRRAGMRDYGSSEGQLGAMPAAIRSAILSSPPYTSVDTKPRKMASGPPKHSVDGGSATRGIITTLTRTVSWGS